MTNTIYTIGYSGVKAPALAQFADAHQALVADVRVSPRARAPEWNRGPLELLLGDQYQHIKAFGNDNYKGTRGVGTMLHNAELGIRWAQEALSKSSIILLCACWNVEECHRKEVAELIQSVTGSPIVHLRKSDMPSDPPAPVPKSYLTQDRLI